MGETGEGSGREFELTSNASSVWFDASSRAKPRPAFAFDALGCILETVWEGEWHPPDGVMRVFAFSAVAAA